MRLLLLSNSKCEGTGFRIEDGSARLLGDAPCRIFHHGEAPRELDATDDFDFLLKAT